MDVTAISASVLDIMQLAVGRPGRRPADDRERQTAGQTVTRSVSVCLRLSPCCSGDGFKVMYYALPVHYLVVAKLVLIAIDSQHPLVDDKLCSNLFHRIRGFACLMECFNIGNSLYL